ncbi:hypothetical protein FISHEDRAFT_28915, partial [Fistulina hepatica ATCC 64428]
QPRSRRGARFTSVLTTEGDTDNRSESNAGTGTSRRRRQRPQTRAQEPPPADDLTSTLIHALKTAPYPDCPICFSSIYPAQPTWSCSPLIQTLSEDGPSQYCWTTFHLKCVRSWASKSVKEIADALAARGRPGTGTWRCPGCQGIRDVVPNGYWCFCGAAPEPKLTRLATPHSCGNPCSRPRDTCTHPCPLNCHPGPCPSCQVTIQLECSCPAHKVISFKCGSQAVRTLSCGAVCGRALSCGNPAHRCTALCHEDACQPCSVMERVRCWCRRDEKVVRCGDCVEPGSQDRQYSCGESCGLPFDCRQHRCQAPCHPSSPPAHCPFSPDVVLHCPCGRRLLSELPQEVERTSCLSPIPTCSSICGKPLQPHYPACTHECQSLCHEGACPPCSQDVERTCRCGATTQTVKCHDLSRILAGGAVPLHLRDAVEMHDDVIDVLCDRPCTALRACGRHQCGRLCCPLSGFAVKAGGKKGKQRKLLAVDIVGDVDFEGLHQCSLPCNRVLNCGIHRCEAPDHRGACPPCLQSGWEEMVCACGRTVIEPPIPCGTKMRCSFPCTRPPPPCGHPRSDHACHGTPLASPHGALNASSGDECPPCPFLTVKPCACGKKMVKNVRCSLEREKVSCGAVCGRLMPCGFHRCQRTCHADDCGECTAPCGKDRKSCLPLHHPCTHPCHAPAACPEDAPCEAMVTLTCPCGRIKQTVVCGNGSTSRSAKDRANMKCNNECQIAKRNARLADALGIAVRDDAKSSAKVNVEYKDPLVSFAKSPANTKFLPLVEKAFGDFVKSERKTHVLPHMPPERRKFVHELANVYRMDVQMVDQEPHRSVQLLRRVDTRVPEPLLSQVVAGPTSNSNSTGSLGKLANLR